MRSGTMARVRSGVTAATAVTAGAVLLVGLVGCSGGSGHDRSATATAKTGMSSPGAAVASSPAADARRPVYQAVRGFYDAGTRQTAKLRVKVYPLQRVAGALLLTVEFTVENPRGVWGADRWFEYHPNSTSRAMYDDVSLIDTQRLVRYAPLQEPVPGGPSYSSQNMYYKTETPGVTYRSGAFFPDPGPDVHALSVDLQHGGMYPQVPISDDVVPAAGLVDGPAGASAAPSRADLVVRPVKAPVKDAVVRRFDLEARVAGGTVNEGTGGLVTVNADVLFAFDSAQLGPQAAALVRQAAGVIAAKADPAKPVAVTGHTDAKGGDAYNQQLSERRAGAVSAALTATGLLPGYALRAQGRAAKEPVAPNTTPSGADDPAGRALNRRVEIRYTPKPVTTSGSTGATTVVTGAGADTGAGTGAGSGAGSGAGIAMPHGSVNDVGISPTVYPVVNDGRLSLVRFDLTVDGKDSAWLGAALSNVSRAGYDVGAVRVTDPATKKVYLAANDVGSRERILGTYLSYMFSGDPYHHGLYVAGLPADVTTVDITLGNLSTVTGVPVSHG